jgi:predicted MFS family arabinose efflux permease
MAGFLGVTAVGLLAVAILWLFMPETKATALETKPASA